MNNIITKRSINKLTNYINKVLIEDRDNGKELYTKNSIVTITSPYITNDAHFVEYFVYIKTSKIQNDLDYFSISNKENTNILNDLCDNYRKFWHYVEFEFRGDFDDSIVCFRFISLVNNNYSDICIATKNNAISPKNLGLCILPMSNFLVDTYIRFNDKYRNHKYAIITECLSELNKNTINKEGMFNDPMLHLTTAVMYHIPIISDVIKLEEFYGNFRNVDMYDICIRYDNIFVSLVEYMYSYNINYTEALGQIDLISRFILWNSKITSYNREPITPINYLLSNILDCINNNKYINNVTILSKKMILTQIANMDVILKTSKSFNEAWNHTYNMIMHILILANSVNIDELKEDIFNLEERVNEKIGELSSRIDRINRDLEFHVYSVNRAKHEKIERKKWLNSIDAIRTYQFIYGDTEKAYRELSISQKHA